MAGDPFRDAVRAALNSVISAASPAIAWVQRDTLNTADNPDASAGYFELEFPGASESQQAFGSPGQNEFLEQGQITLRVVTPAGRFRDTAEAYADQLRKAFRGKRIAFTEYGSGRQIFIDAVASMGGGHTEAGMWAESLALAYRVYPKG